MLHTMKKLLSIVALAVALSVSASAQSGLGNLDLKNIGNVLTNMAGADWKLKQDVSVSGSLTQKIVVENKEQADKIADIGNIG